MNNDTFAETPEDEWKALATTEITHLTDEEKDYLPHAWDEWIARVRRAAAKAAWDEAIEEALDGWTIPASGDIEAVRYILLSTNPYIPKETP